MTLPTDALTVEIAFTTNYYSTASWTDVTDYCISFTTERGRSSPIEVIDPGTASFVFDNTSGDWDPDDINGPWYGHLRPNKRIRVSHGSTRLFTGYVDAMRRTWPGGSNYSECMVTATDRFKQLARSRIDGARADETADARLTHLLSAVTFTTINSNGYASRTVGAHAYEGDLVLQAAQDVARSDGGVLFVDAAGTVVFQTATFRQSNTRSTSSQGTFGNHGTAVPIEADVVADVDDELMANTVILTDYEGGQWVADDPAAALIDGDLVLDLGSTMLVIGTEAAARATEVLNMMIDAKPRWRSITLDVLTTDDALTHALAREISDRITVAIVPPGQSYGYSRQQFIESVSHAVTLAGTPQWLTTFGLSPLPGAASEGRALITAPPEQDATNVTGDGWWHSDSYVAWPGGPLSPPPASADSAFRGYLVVPTGEPPTYYDPIWGAYLVGTYADGSSAQWSGGIETVGAGPFTSPAGDLYRFAFGPDYDDNPEPLLPDAP